MMLSLKVAIVKSGRKSYEIAHELGWHSSKVSHIINGVQRPTIEEKDQLAQILGTAVADIFPDEEV